MRKAFMLQTRQWISHIQTQRRNGLLQTYHRWSARMHNRPCPKRLSFCRLATKNETILHYFQLLEGAIDWAFAGCGHNSGKNLGMVRVAVLPRLSCFDILQSSLYTFWNERKSSTFFSMAAYMNTVFCPGFQKGRVPSEKGTLARWTDRQKGTLARWTEEKGHN